MLCAICGSPMYAGGICPRCTLGYEEGKSQVAAADLRVEVQRLRADLERVGKERDELLWRAFHSGVCVGHATPEGGTVARYREQFELWRKEQP